MSFHMILISLLIIIDTGEMHNAFVDDYMQRTMSLRSTGFNSLQSYSNGTSGAKEDMRALNGKEIDAELRSRAIEPDFLSGAESVSFSEHFFADGSWQSSRQERAPVVLKGSWKIVSDRICVLEGNSPQLCRQVMKDNIGRLHIADMFSGSRSNVPVLMKVLVLQ